ncbi:MAG: ABC transporter permease [Candidatus Helarchaeota archaeon]|nr:ABC transporter permease [Candidatus Helarchaeota archaeon]
MASFLDKNIFRRVITVIPVVFIAVTIIFFISHLVPGDPARLIAGQFANEDQVEKIRKEYNLDKPIPIQYILYLRDTLRGEFGISMHTRRPIMQDIKEFYPATIELGLVSIFLIITIGVPLGVISAIKKDKLLDHFSRFFAIGGVAAPVFWVGILAQLLFFYKLGILPIGDRLSYGITSPEHITGLYLIDSLLTRNWKVFWDSIYHIILPAMLMSVSSMSSVVRQTRNEMLSVMKEDYVLFHTAYGLSTKIVVYKYALRNALTPTISVLGLTFGLLLSRCYLVETICGWPGIGRYVAMAVLTSDFPAISGATMIIAFSYVFINLAVDIAYMLLNPKVKL